MAHEFPSVSQLVSRGHFMLPTRPSPEPNDRTDRDVEGTVRTFGQRLRSGKNLEEVFTDGQGRPAGPLAQGH
jgi:hypothetical protein